MGKNDRTARIGNISKNKNANMRNYEPLKNFKMIILIVLLSVVFCVPYLRGLYFEPEQFLTQIITFSLFTVFWIYKWIKNDKSFLRSPIEYAGFGMTIIYLLSSFTAVSQRLAVSEFLKYAMYFVVFFMLSDLVKSEKEKSIVLWTIVSSGLGLCIIGIDSAAGGKIVNLFNNIFKVLNLKVEFFGLFVDGRIHSTLQYPNAFASYLIAVFFISISLIMTSGKWIRALSSAISFLILTTFIFTISRGAYVLLIFAVVMFLLLLPKESKLKALYILLSIGLITVCFSFILSQFIYSTTINKLYVWLFIILGIALSFSVSLTDKYVLKILERINWKIASTVILLLVIASAFVTGYIFNASIPLELGHSISEKDEDKVVIKRVELDSNKKYKMVFNVEATSKNEKADYVYRIIVRSKDESAIVTDKDIVLSDKKFENTKGIEEQEIEFTVPEDSKVVNIRLINHYAGTSVKFHDAKIIDVKTGKQVKSLILKHKYSFAESILSRFENLFTEKSYNTRLYFIKDGLKIFKDWWLMGAGGGAWSILNFKYQSYLYWSTQTHNYPLQVVIETGLIGIIFFLMFLISIIMSFIKLYKKDATENINEKTKCIAIFISVLFLFLHAAVDFDFSLSSIYLLVWVLVALLNNYAYRHLDQKEKDSVTIRKSKKRSDFEWSLEGLKKVFEKGFNVKPVFVIIATIAVLIYPIIFYSAYNISNKALDSYNNSNLDEALGLMERATSLDYLNTKYVTGYAPISTRPDIRIGYIDLILKKMEAVSKQSGDKEVNSEEKKILNSYMLTAQKLIKKVEGQAKFNSELSMNLGVYYLNTVEKDKGLDFISKSVYLKPFVPGQWQLKANAIYATAISYLKQGDNEKGIDKINDLLKIIDEATNVNKSNLAPFVFNIATQEYLEKSYYIKKESEEKHLNIDNLVFQSIFEMDINSDNVPDQWYINDVSGMNINLENGVFSVDRNDLSNNPYISTRGFTFEPNSVYRIEVVLDNQEDVKSIPYRVMGISDTLQQMYLKGDVYSSQFKAPDRLDGNNSLRIYIKDNYKIKSVRVIKED